MKHIVIFFILAILCIAPSMLFAQDYGVYVKVIEKAAGTFEEVVGNVEDGLKKSDWQVLASYKSSVPEGCRFKAYNIVINSAQYAKQIMSHGPLSAFVLPLRVSVYEDESGINVAFMNPASLNRTVLGDSVEKDISVNTMNKLSDIISSSVKGNIAKKQIGEIRSKGKVGGMGGGNFIDMVEEIYKIQDSGSAFQDTVKKVKDGLLQNNKEWKLVYTVEFAEHGVVVYGVNKEKTAVRAFKIAGEKRESETYRCPGIDHVSAFPVEVVILREKGVVRVVVLDEMYRMKVYFEDAGNWAFMKNMKMPGDIQREIVEMSTSKLK